MIKQEEILFYGHRNIQALHKRTLEVTKDDHLTLRGDCIIGINSNKACKDMDERIKDAIRSSCSIKIMLVVDNSVWEFKASGSERLTLEDSRSMVVRRSDYVCTRTLAVRSSAAAADMPRSMVDALKNGGKGLMIIEVED